MALIAVMSAKGAPGATTTALLLANLWPRPTVVVDADPLGGDIALRLSGEHGPLQADRGLMSLLPAARRGLTAGLVVQHTQTAVGGQKVVPGLPGPEQAVAVAPMWPGLADAFAQVLDHDVFVDVGQLHGRSPHLALVERAVALVCVYRPTAWSVVHTRRRLESLEDLLRPRRTVVGIVCVSDPDEPGAAREAASGVAEGLDWVTDLGTVALDPRTVAMYEGGTVYRPERSLLARSGAAVVGRLHGLVGPVGPAPRDGVPAEPTEEPVDAGAATGPSAQEWASQREAGAGGRRRALRRGLRRGSGRAESRR